MPGINVERLVILAEAGTTLRQQKQTLGIVVHREQLFRDGGGLGRVPGLQVGLQQSAQTFGMRVEVGSLLQVPDGALRIVALEGGLPAQQQNVADRKSTRLNSS